MKTDTATTRSSPELPPAPEWLQRKERGNLFWLSVMRWLSLSLGRRTTRVIVYVIALYFVIAAPAARWASRDYLARVLAHPVGWFDLYRHILTFSCTIHDRIYLLNNRYELFDIDIRGGAELHALHARNQGCFLFGAHLGSFEMLRSIARDNSQLNVCVAMYPENARQINESLAAINPQVIVDIITLGQLDSMLAIHQRINQGSMVGVLADRASGKDKYISIPFLGSPARFPTGPFRMAAMLKHPVYFMTGIYKGGNRYEIQFELLANFSEATSSSREEDVHKLLTSYVTAVERHCQADPYNWFNFYDFWKPIDSENL